MIELFNKILEKLSDPIAIVLMPVVGGLLYLIYHKDKCITKMSQEHDAALEGLKDRLVTELQCVNNTLAGQVKLLEFVIYNKGDQK
jgi:hypothetical protein